jgi:hypothetical protein
LSRGLGLRAFLNRSDLDRLARWASFVVLVGCAVAVYFIRYPHLQPLVASSSVLDIWFWDAKVFAIAAEYVETGRNPYLEPLIRLPFDQPFISAPVVAWTLAELHGLLGMHVNTFALALHFVGLVVTPLISARLFLGPTWSDAAFGYALFLCGLGAFGVTTVLSGNFGVFLYMLIFAAIAVGVRRNAWGWFHAAVAFAVQVKFPYALLWIVPVMANGWSWRQAGFAVFAALASVSVYAFSYAIEPAYFLDWVRALSDKVMEQEDFGYSIYGVTMNLVGDSVSWLPYLLHVAVFAALFAFLLVDRTEGPLRVAALVTFAIVANPRMKDYDIAFAAIPVGALIFHALASSADTVLRRAIAVGAVTTVALILLKADRLPIPGDYVFVGTAAAGIVALAFVRHAVASAPGMNPVLRREFSPRSGVPECRCG